MSFAYKLTITALAIAFPMMTYADTDGDFIKAKFEKTYPAMKIKSITPTPIPGLYEVFANGNILYIDKSGQYVLAGASLVDDTSQHNLTAERMRVLTAIKFESLPLKDSIEVKKGSGAYHFAVFTDPDCPHCKTLEQGLAKLGIDNYTAHIFLLPIKELHPEAREKSESIWCSKDKATAWTSWMIEGKLPEKSTCENPIERNLALSQDLNVLGTPTIFLENGNKATSPQELVDAIKSKSGKKVD